jgi:hypothetical protein
MDANNSKELSVSGLIYALQHVVRKGDVLKLLGIITYIRHPLRYKCRVKENAVGSRILRRFNLSKTM